MELQEWLELEEKLPVRKRTQQMALKAREAATLVKREYGANVYLFGSLAKGRVHARSDVDLLVCGYFTEPQKQEIIRRIEGIVMPYPVNILFEDEVSTQFKGAIKEKGLKLTC